MITNNGGARLTIVCSAVIELTKKFGKTQAFELTRVKSAGLFSLPSLHSAETCTESSKVGFSR